MWPKKCGHFEGKQIIPLEEHVEKIKAAIYARGRSDLVVVARTDARAIRFEIFCRAAIADPSQVDGRSFPHDVSIKDWQSAGLPKPTLIRLSKLVTVEAKLVRRTLGKRTPHDRTATKTAFQRLFRAWVA